MGELMDWSKGGKLQFGLSGRRLNGTPCPEPDGPITPPLHRPIFPRFPIDGRAWQSQFLRTMSKTLFEKIIAREIPAAIVYEDDRVLAFRDIKPQAPTHVLLIPKKPIPRVGEATQEDQELLGYLMLKAAEVASQLGLAKSGYRLVFNNGPDAGEAVPHLHCHILGGRSLGWPPG